MEPAAEDVNAYFGPRFDDDGSAALFIVPRCHQLLPLDVFPMARRDHDRFRFAHIVCRLHQHLFLAEIMMVTFAIFHILQLKTIRNPPVDLAILRDGGKPYAIANGAVRRRHPDAIHLINDDGRTRLGHDSNIDTNLRKVRMGASERRGKSENRGASGSSEKLMKTMSKHVHD
jgi:hypothetical protein